MPMFSKRHYEELAQIMKETKPTEAYPDALRVWGHVCDKLSLRFSADSSAYRPNQFMRACGRRE